MIRVSKLFKSFNGQPILEDINLDVKQGEIVAILGASGAGKSVLLKHIIGLLKPDTGSVVIDSVDITPLSESELLKVRQKMGYLFQEGALYDFMTVLDNIAFPLREHTKFSEKEIKSKVQDVLRFVDLEDVEEKFPAELSGGMKKRVGLARSIVTGSKILLCDEPTSGLDPIRSHDISDLIYNISRKINCTTILTSHDVPNAFRIADRLAIVNDGKIIALGTKEELKSSKDPFVYKFLNS
jgi:phospholipid/cholesterol/gamma-HCH transport system ATP-binding protein